MGLFSKRAKADDPAHPAPVEIDLGVRQVFEVQIVVAKLVDEGCHVYLVDQSDIAKAAELYPKHCRLLVAPADEERVRAELVASGFL